MIEKYINDKKALELSTGTDQKETEQQIDNLKTGTANQVKKEMQKEETLQGLVEVINL